MGNRVVMTPATVFSRACSSPGAVQHTSVTWSAMSKVASSTQIGRPHPRGLSIKRCRKRGTDSIRSDNSRRRSTREIVLGAANFRTAATCIEVPDTSHTSSIRSVADTRWISTTSIPTTTLSHPLLHLQIGRYAALGAQRVYLQVLDQHDLDHLDLLATEVMPHV